MIKIAIVGGGLSGLSAAYTLAKRGYTDIVLFESEPELGGRIQSRSIRGHNIDFGGFLIYPWYENAHALLGEIGLESNLIKTPLKDIYYFLNSKDPQTENNISFPVTDTLKVWSKSILKLLQLGGVAEPNLEIFDRRTISQYLRDSLGVSDHAGIYELFFDTVSQGYCYGPSEQTQMSLMAPFIRQTALHGNVHYTSFLPEGTQAIANNLAASLRKLGVEIRCCEPVTGINGRTITTTQGALDADKIIFAQTVSPELYNQIVPGVPTAIWYTHFITVAVELSETPRIRGEQTWGAAFYSSDTSLGAQTLSAINLHSLHGDNLRECLMLNIVLRDVAPDTINSERLTEIVKSEIQRLFPETAFKQILDFVHWKKTMPVAHESFIDDIQKLQGVGGYYFSGDFLGAPSIETAITTGVQIAEKIAKS